MRWFNRKGEDKSETRSGIHESILLTLIETFSLIPLIWLLSEKKKTFFFFSLLLWWPFLAIRVFSFPPLFVPRHLVVAFVLRLWENTFLSPLVIFSPKILMTKAFFLSGYLFISSLYKWRKGGRRKRPVEKKNQGGMEGKSEKRKRAFWKKVKLFYFIFFFFSYLSFRFHVGLVCSEGEQEGVRFVGKNCLT